MDSQFASVYKYIYTFIYIYTAYTTYTTYTKTCRWQWLKSWSGVGSFVCHSLHLVTFPLCKCRWLFVLHKVEARLLAEYLFFWTSGVSFLGGFCQCPTRCLTTCVVCLTIVRHFWQILATQNSFYFGWRTGSQTCIGKACWQANRPKLKIILKKK